MDNDKNVSPPNQSGNMYSYQEEQKNQKEFGFEEGAIKRSLGERNPNFTPEYQINNNIMNDDRALHQNSIVIQVDQSPPLYWMLFASFLLVQIIVLIFFAIYYDWVTKSYIIKFPSKSPTAKSLEERDEAPNVLHLKPYSFINSEVSSSCPLFI